MNTKTSEHHGMHNNISWLLSRVLHDTSIIPYIYRWFWTILLVEETGGYGN